MSATEAQAEVAIGVLKRMIDAAENGNQAGEDAVVAAAAGLALLDALQTAQDYVSDASKGALKHDGDSAGLIAMASDDLARINAAIAKATAA